MFIVNVKMRFCVVWIKMNTWYRLSKLKVVTFLRPLRNSYKFNWYSKILIERNVPPNWDVRQSFATKFENTGKHYKWNELYNHTLIRGGTDVFKVVLDMRHVLLRFSSSDGCERVDELWVFRKGHIQLFQLRLSPSKVEMSNTSAKGCWETLKIH